jgi:hypothetical protein
MTTLSETPWTEVKNNATIAREVGASLQDVAKQRSKYTMDSFL